MALKHRFRLLLALFLTLACRFSAAAVPLIGPTVPASDWDFEAPGSGPWTYVEAQEIDAGLSTPPLAGQAVINEDVANPFSISQFVGPYAPGIATVDFAIVSRFPTRVTISLPDGSSSGAIALPAVDPRLGAAWISTVLGAPITFNAGPNVLPGLVTFTFSDIVDEFSVAIDRVSLSITPPTGAPELDAGGAAAPLLIAALALLTLQQTRPRQALR